MGADNWRDCPECEAKLDAAADKAKKKADDAYGKLPRERFEELVAKAAEARRVADTPDESRRTLREDYQLGTWGKPPALHVSYRAECSSCGFGVSFAETRELPKGSTVSHKIGRDYEDAGR